MSILRTTVSRSRSVATRRSAAMLAAVACVAALLPAAPAQAAQWSTQDTDNISRATPSQKAYMTGNFRWQQQLDDGEPFDDDFRARFSTRLTATGKRGSCVALRVFVYKKDAGTNPNVRISKRFPAAGDTRFGYIRRCKSSSNNTWRVKGIDDLFDYNQSFAQAVLRVCWTRNSDVPPGGDCYTFTIRPGD